MNRTALILIAFAVVVLSGPMAAAADSEVYVETDIRTMLEKPADFARKHVRFTAYLLGAEYSEDDYNGDVWVIALGAMPTDDAPSDTVIRPDIAIKVRAVETGYNRDVIDRCRKLSTEAAKRGESIVVSGVYLPGANVRQYHGIDVALSSLKIGKTTIDTDFNDVSEFTGKAPARAKRLYKTGKKLADLVGKAF
jgi:hypothetical protein